MPLRSMIYFVNTLEDWLKKNEKDLFGRKQIRIPTPHFVVFYNGLEKRPEYEEMRLSQSFYHPTEEPQIEVICKVYNINPENNQELKGKSPVLDGYTYFVEKVRDNQTKDMNLKEAVADAIEDCIKNHILEDFFISRKDEVKKMTQEEIDKIYATIYCEQKSQKGILIGKNGSLLKKIGMEARKELEEILEKKVYLELYVKLEKNWRKNKRILKDIGYEQFGN